MAAQKRAGRVSKDQWLATALEELEKGGIGAVRVERLAKLLSVAKSGFYWHFKDRRDLHQHLLDYWFHEYTAVVTANPLLHQGDPKSRLAKVMAMVEDHDLAKYDIAIRAWAEHDEMARAVVEEVTKARLDFIRSIFAELGFKSDELEARTMVFVCYETWEGTMFSDVPARKRRRLRKHRLELLTRQ